MIAVVGASLKRAQAEGRIFPVVAAQHAAPVPVFPLQRRVHLAIPCLCSARFPKRASFLSVLYFINVPE